MNHEPSEGDRAADERPNNVYPFPTSEYMRARLRHPAGRKLGAKSIEQAAEAQEDDDEPDDPQPA